MNAAQIHLALNHLPVLLPVVGICLVALGLFQRSETVQRIGLSLWLVAALAAIPVYLTGEPTESIVKNYPGVSRAAIHEHEKSAKMTLVVIEIVGLLSVVQLLALRRKKAAPGVWIAMSLCSILCLGLLLRTAHLGGEIRHEEIQSEEFLKS